MGYIYLITNNINGKQYVGKISSTVEKRWHTHIKDSFSKDTALYRAIRKYGAESFSIKILENCKEKNLSKQEQYWILKLNTYKNGYNETYGGEGRLLYDYKKLADKYLELKNLQDTANFFNCDRETVRRACLSYNIKIETAQEKSKIKNSKKVLMINKDTEEIIQYFNSQSDAARFLQENEYSLIQDTCKLSYKIGQVCRGIRKTCCGFKWRYY